ncbi:MAG: hypothetical protein LAT56_00210 [Wenzhouxiangella sp.]|nr:hypothetical protein [Wenzhouxiangella sp.]
MNQEESKTVRGWLSIYSKYEIAAICCVSLGTVNSWVKREVLPAPNAKLLDLFTGNITGAAWEDEVFALAKELHEKEKARK